MKIGAGILIICAAFLAASNCCAVWIDVTDDPSLINIDVSSNTGESFAPCLRLNSLDKPCIAWHDYTYSTPTAEILYAQWNGFTWVDASGSGTSFIDVSNNTGDSMCASLVLDSLNRPHIAWMDNTPGNYEIYYLWWNGASWVDAAGAGASFIDVSNNTGNSSYPSLALDGAGNPHIAWTDDTLGRQQVFYSYWNGSAWDFAGGNVDASNTTFDSYSPSLVLDISGKPHIAWAALGEIFYLKWNGLDWVDTDGTGRDSMNVSWSFTRTNDGNAWNPKLRLDSAGRPNVLYQFRGSFCCFAAIYTRWNGSAWTSASGAYPADMVLNLPDYFGVSEFVPDISFELDSNDRPGATFSIRMSYMGDTRSSINYRHFNGAIWASAEGSPWIYDAYSNSINGYTCGGYLDFDSADNPCIAWQDWQNENREIYYFHWTATATPTVTPSATCTITQTQTYTFTATQTPTDTATASMTASCTGTDIPTGTQTSMPTVTLTATATATSTPYAEGDIIIYPNPYDPGKGPLKILHLPIDASFAIYTLSGERVISFPSAGAITLWNGKNTDGKNSSQGIYMYIAKWDNNRQIRSGKIYLFK